MAPALPFSGRKESGRTPSEKSLLANGCRSLMHFATIAFCLAVQVHKEVVEQKTLKLLLASCNGPDRAV